MAELFDKRFKLMPGLPVLRIRLDVEGRQKIVDAPAPRPALPLPVDPQSDNKAYARAQRRRENFLEKLFRGIAGRHPDLTTQIQIVGLEPVRRRFDIHWDVIEGKVHQVVRLIIRQEIRPQDSFVAINNMRYAITFVKREQKDAEACVQRIRQKILATFLSEATFQTGDVDIALGQMVKTRPLRQNRASLPDAEIERRHVETQTEQTEKPLFFRPSVVGAGYQTEERNMMRPPLLLDENRRPIIPKDIQYRFRAVYDQAQGRVAAFRYFCSLAMEGYSPLYEYDVLPVEAGDDMYLRLDTAMLSRVAKDVEKFLASSARLLCPVHYRTISDRGRRMVYLRALKEISPEVLKQNLGFEILHMPRALYGADLEDPVRALTHITPYVVLRCPIDAELEGAYAEVGMMAVSTLFTGMENDPLPVAQRKMSNFVKAATRRQLRTFAFGLETEKICATAEKAGFSCLCGDGVLKKYPGQPPPDHRQ